MPPFDDSDDDLFDAPQPKRPSNRIVHQPPGAQWSLDRLPEVESLYQSTFKKRLPLTNRGQGSIHNKWGYDHRNSADVSINPSTPEGQQFIEGLKKANVPFLAFSGAVPGVATGPHIHIGFPSKRTQQKFNVGSQKKSKSVASEDLFDTDDDLFDSGQTLPPTQRRNAGVQPADSTASPTKSKAPSVPIEQALQRLIQETNETVRRFTQPTATGSSNLGELQRMEGERAQHRRNVRRQAAEELRGRRGAYGAPTPSGILNLVANPVSSFTNLFKSDDQVVDEMTNERLRQESIAQEPEVIASRKEAAQYSPAARSVIKPLGRGAAGVLHLASGLSSLGGYLPKGYLPPADQLSEWAKRRAEIIDAAASGAPLTEDGQELEISVPEKVATGIADLGVGLASIIALKKATKLPFNQLLALEGALKASDKPLDQQVGAAVQGYTLGTALERIPGRAANAAISGIPTAAQTGYEVSQGRMSPVDAAIQTGIQAGSGAILTPRRRPSSLEHGLQRESPRARVEPNAEIAARLRGERSEQDLAAQDRSVSEAREVTPSEVSPVGRAPAGQQAPRNLAGEPASKPDIRGVPVEHERLPRSLSGEQLLESYPKQENVSLPKGRVADFRPAGSEAQHSGSRRTPPTAPEPIEPSVLETPSISIRVAQVVPPPAIAELPDGSAQVMITSPSGRVTGYDFPNVAEARAYKERYENAATKTAEEQASRSGPLAPRRDLPELIQAVPQGTQMLLKFSRKEGRVTDEQLKSLFPDYYVTVERKRNALTPEFQGVTLTFWNKDGTRQVKAPADAAQRFGLAETFYRGHEPRLLSDTPTEAPQKFYHRDFGEVVESSNQRRVGKGRVRVTDEGAREHIIKRAALTGAGNQRAVPVKETKLEVPEESTVTSEQSPAEPLRLNEQPAAAVSDGANKISTETTAAGFKSDLSLSQFVRKMGGVVPTEDLRGELNRIRVKDSGTTGLINQRARQGDVKQTADILMQAANDAGFRDPNTGRPFENPGDFLLAVERDVMGDKIRVRTGEEDFSAAEAEYYTEQEARVRAEEARNTFLESGRGAELFDRIIDRKASDAERQEYIELAERAGISRAESADLIADARAEIESLQADGSARAQPSDRPAEQLGFVQEGLTQESVPPRSTSQRDALIRAEQERQSQLNPERTAALAKLEEIRRRGMTVDDYARQPDLSGKVPSSEEIAALRELEGAPLREASRPQQEYDAALNDFRAISKRHSDAAKKYRAREIGDNEYLSARREFDAAQRKMDEAERRFEEQQASVPDQRELIRQRRPGEGGFAATSGPAKTGGPVLKEARRAVKLEPDPVSRRIVAGIKRLPEQLQTALISEFTPLRKLEEAVRGKDVAVDMARKFEQVAGAPAKAEADFIEFKNAVVDPIRQRTDDFNAYLFLKRVEDRISKDPERKKVASWTVEKAQQGLKELEQSIGRETMAKFEEVGKVYQDQMNRALKLQVESGRMTPELYDKIVNSNDFYAPFKVLKYIEQSEHGGGRNIATTQQLTKKITGIESEDFQVGNILQSSAEQIMRSRVLAEKNLKMQELAKLADTENDLIKKVPTDHHPRPGYEVVRYLENGKPQGLEVSGDVAKAVRGLNAAQASAVAKAALIFRRGLQWGATGANAGFQVVNLFFADLPRQALVSRYGLRSPKDVYQFPLDWAYSLGTSIKGNFGKPNELFMDWLRSGAANSTIQRELTPEVFRPKPISPGRTHPVKRVVDSVAQFSNAIEETSKILGLKRALRIEKVKDMTPEQRQAAMEKIAAELRNFSGSPDFLRRGSETRNLNLLFMFFNARLQGVSSDIRRLAGKAGKPEAVAAWARIGTMVGIPTTALAIVNNLPQYRDDYDKIPDWEKKSYFMIPRESFFRNEDTGEMVRDYWRVPKRDVVGLFGNSIESFVDFAAQRDPSRFKGFASTMLENLSPINIEGENLMERGESVAGSLNPLIKVPIETFSNRDFFRKRPIVPDYMKKASPERQYRKSTPRAYRAAGRALGVSPLRLEHMAEGFTGSGLGQFTVREPQSGRSPMTGYPIVRRFVRSGSVKQDRGVSATERSVADKQLQRREIRDEMTARARRGESVDIDAAVRSGELTESDRKQIQREAKMSERQARFADFQPSTALDRYERMDEAQREEVRDLMEKKAYTLLHSDSLTQDQKDGFAARIDTLGLAPRNPRESSSGGFRSRLTGFRSRFREATP